MSRIKIKTIVITSTNKTRITLDHPGGEIPQQLRHLLRRLDCSLMRPSLYGPSLTSCS